MKPESFASRSARHTATRWLVTGAVLGVLACSPRPLPEPSSPVPVVPATVMPEVSPWPAIFSRARRAAETGRFGEADRLLAEFIGQHAASPEAGEAAFWRALISADPANTASNVADQIAAFDAYLTSGPSLPRYAEARILRRMVEALDSTRALVVAVRATADARDRAKSDEVRRLSDELEKTVAEMERIKRRLAPRPPDEKRPPQ